ncbi:CubicO group peptidase (beta-lactamase class C family) [Georgenia soli]|uniref:CubicO group peptidase (Beta-lactamase class C family) n=1 Tax=Georgenia soli TaxID=638953 RepID=A0A2A9EMX5_9MICO|nr:serine hydrolase domain-containing protein [Georgenia soli]PFG39580.1 CubicO group peptidase (beta-lactamase class C family) [Georgenia soli]
MRRTLTAAALGAALVGAAVVPAGAATPPGAPTAMTARTVPADAGTGRSAVATADPWDRTTSPPRTLKDGSPSQAGLDAAALAAIEPALTAGLTTRPNPVYPGAVALVASKGVVAERTAVGHSLRWADPTTELPASEQVEMRTDTIFDLASISKLFTAVAVMQLVESGEVSLEDRVADHIPAFAANGKADVTVEQLLTHTGGLPAWIPLYTQPDLESRLAAVYAVRPAYEPGTGYVYSDLGLITLGEIVETVSGQRLDEYVGEHITGPLGMSDTMYNPPEELLPRIAATEYQPALGRGLVHGEVHDENAWSLGGVAGHAGVFSTADDLAVFAQMLLNGGRYGQARILEPATVQEMMQDRTGDISSNHRGLGPELEAWFYHDALTSPGSAGHTGYTGTSLVIDPWTETIAILMTNRVHPSRDWGSPNPQRRAVARAAGLAAADHRFTQGQAWHSGSGDRLRNTLSLDVTVPDGGAELALDLWFHTEETDRLVIEASDDGGATWQHLPGTLVAGPEERASDGVVSGFGDHRWWDATFPLDGLAGDVTVRLSYVTDALYSGQGVYLDRVRVDSDRGPLFDDRRPADRERMVAEGWTLAE